MNDNLSPISRHSSDLTEDGHSRPFGFSGKSLLSVVAVLFVLSGLGVTSFLVSQMSPTPTLGGAASPDANRERQTGADTTSVSARIASDKTGIPIKPTSDPRMSILLLGYGGAGHDGAYLTDSIMLAIADPTRKTLTLLSVPRDSWVPLLFDGKNAIYNKVNTAFAFAKDTSLYRDRLARYGGDHGAGNFVADTVARLLGVPISNYLGMDFEGFRQMIDAVDGIDVNVPDSFTARYPANDNPDVDPSWMTVRFRKGETHMTGERAIEFARAREVIDNPSESNDFARARRQRIIMEAFKTRLFELGGLIHLPQILAIAARHVDTNYPLTSAGQLSQFILGWKNVHIYQTALTSGNYLAEGTGPEGTYVLVPSAPDRSWDQIRAFTRRLWQDPATGVEMANTKIVVVNDTGVAGLAGSLSDALVKLGYQVGTPESGSEQAESRLVDRTGGQAKLVAAQLEKDLGVQFQESSDSSAGDSNELVLELGADDKALADLSVPPDDAAPSSAVGVMDSEGWSPVVAPPAPQKAATATPTPVASSGSKPKLEKWPTSVAKETPSSSATPTPLRAGLPTATHTTTSATPTAILPTATATKTSVPLPRPSPSPTP